MITLITGKSASGKDSLFKELVKNGYKPIVTCTTRPKREGEQEGIDYYYKTKEAFLKMVETGEIFEHRKYNTKLNGIPDVWYYGSPKIENKTTDKNVAVVDLEGAESYINEYGNDGLEIIHVFVDNKERERRAKIRGSFSQVEWDRRIEDDEIKFSLEKLKNLQEKLGKELVFLDNNSSETPFKKVESIL